MTFWKWRRGQKVNVLDEVRDLLGSEPPPLYVDDTAATTSEFTMAIYDIRYLGGWR